MIRRGLALLLCVLAACAGGGSGGGGGGGPKGCKCVAPGCPTVSFNGNIQPIFNQSCATTSQCHAVNGAQDLDLSQGHSIQNTVNVKSTEQPKLLRIKPGDPDVSYLYQKIIGAPTISGILMPQGCPGTPLGGAVCLDNNQISAINQWIVECATDTPSLP